MTDLSPPRKPARVLDPTAFVDRFFGLTIVGLTVIFAFATAIFLYHDRERTLDAVQQRIVRSAALLTARIENSLDQADAQILELAEALKWADPSQPFYAEYYDDYLQKVADQSDAIDVLLILDLDGDVIMPLAKEFAGVNVVDRPYFQRALRAPMGEHVVGLPLNNRVDGASITVIAWPLPDLMGRVHAVAAAPLGEDHLSELFRQTVFSSDALVSVIAADGTPAFKNYDVSAAGGRYVSATRDVGTTGLKVSVRVPYATALTDFREHWIRYGGILAALFLLLMGVALLARRQSSALQASLEHTRLATNRAARSEARFDAIVENVGEGIVAFSHDRSVVRVNHKARELLDVPNAEAAVEVIVTGHPELLKKNGPSAVPLSLPDKKRVIRCRVSRAEDAAGPSFFCVLSDATAEESLTRMREEFITSVNHELRTPLTSLRGAVEILNARYSNTFDSGAQNLVSMVQRNAERLLALVNDILTVQAADAGQLLITPEPIALGDAVHEAVQLNAAFGTRASVGIDWAGCDDDCIIQVDPARFQQVMSNLISNAVKYSPKGGRVEVGCSFDGHRAAVWVTDEGPGIPAEAQPRLFERFSAPVHERKVQASGTGLGLYITKDLVERQNGSITLSSRARADGWEETGSTFRLEFPATSLSAPPEHPAQTGIGPFSARQIH